MSIVREAVRLRLGSDVPVGVFLSGGMDSSVVTAIMAAESEQPVRTFSIGFEDRAFDELPYARAVARHCGTIHTEEVVRLDAIELLPDLADPLRRAIRRLLGRPDIPGLTNGRTAPQGRAHRRWR